MTANMINYWKLQEEKRHNLAMESETKRHNVVTEYYGETSANASLAAAYAAQASAGAAQSQAASRAREVSNDYYFSSLASGRAERETQARVNQIAAGIAETNARTGHINAQTRNVNAQTRFLEGAQTELTRAQTGQAIGNTFGSLVKGISTIVGSVAALGA